MNLHEAITEEVVSSAELRASAVDIARKSWKFHQYCHLTLLSRIYGDIQPNQHRKLLTTTAKRAVWPSHGTIRSSHGAIWATQRASCCSV